MSKRTRKKRSRLHTLSVYLPPPHRDYLRRVATLAGLTESDVAAVLLVVGVLRELETMRQHAAQREKNPSVRGG